MSAREELIRTAERLYALHGVEAVSLRQISTAAGQKNVSAVRYHFDDRKGLILAIFGWRLEQIEARRRAMLREVLADGREGDVRALVDVLVRPLAEQAATPDSYYARFLNRMWDHAGRAVVPIGEIGADAAYDAGRLLERAMGHTGTGPITVRGDLAGRLIIAAMADLETRLQLRDRCAVEEEREAYVAAVTDALAGMLTAPASPTGPCGRSPASS